MTRIISSDPGTESAGKLDNTKEPKETLNPATGEYSRLMRPDEYREWVRQTVSGQIWGRMTAIFSAVGFASIVAIFTFSNSAIDGKIATEAKKLNEEVRKALPDSITAELGNQIRNNELVPRISQAAVAQITRDKGVETALQNLIIRQSQNILQERDTFQSSLRAVALQQILLFGEERQKTEAITAILLDEKSGEHEFALALQNFPTHQSKSSVDQRRSLHSILERAARRDANFSMESWRAVEQVLKLDKDIVEACGWIRNAVIPLDKKYSIESFQNIIERIAKTGGLTAGEQFVAWLESSDRELKGLGQHGLMAMQPPEDPIKRHALVAQITRALARTELARNALADHLSETIVAIRQRDRATLRRIADSEFPTPRIKKLINELIQEPESRSSSRWNFEPESRTRWNFADRTFLTVQDLQKYGQYGHYERSLSAYRLLGIFLDTDAKSADWHKLIEPEIASKGGAWTMPSQANLLVNAWVHKLQATASPSAASIDAPAELFIDAHTKRDTNLFSHNTRSYRYLISRAGEAVIAKFLDTAPTMIGMAERKHEGASEDDDENETSILVEVLTQVLRQEDRLLRRPDQLKQVRASFNERMNSLSAQKGNTIWFSAVAQHAGIEGISLKAVDHYKVISSLVERLKKGSAVPALTSLSIVTNKSFLQLQSIRSAVERANLHFLAEDIGRLKSNSLVNDLAQMIATDTKAALDWVGTVEQVAIQIGTAAVPLNEDSTWLTFEAPPSQVAQLTIEPAKETTYTLVDSSKRVLDMQTVRVPKNSTTPAVFNIRLTEPGKQFLRLSVPPPKEATRASLKFQTVYRVADLPSAKKGGIVDINPGSPFTIETKGDDDAWLRLSAKANRSYILRTHSLRSADPDDADIDTVIEVYNSSESRKLKEDDDGGEDAGGEKWSSRLSISPDRDTAYHIRIKNLESIHGTFVFEVLEEPR